MVAKFCCTARQSEGNPILLDYPSPVLASRPLLMFLKIRVLRRTVVRGEVQSSVSQPPIRGPVPGPGINYTGPREILLQLITNLNVILYLSTCHTVHIIVLILFMIMSLLIINTYVSLMYKLKKKIGKVLTSKPVGTGPSSYEKRIYRAAVSQRFRNTALIHVFLAYTPVSSKSHK